MDRSKRNHCLSKINIVIGSETGFLKGIFCDSNRLAALNVNSISEPDKNLEICSIGVMSSGNVIAGQRNRIVQLYDSELSSYKIIDINNGSGSICGLGSLNENVLAGISSGEIVVCKSEPISFRACSLDHKLECMKQNATNPGLIVTGGLEVLPTIWDLNKPDSPCFKGKNIPMDNLQLRVPVKVSSVDFLDGEDKICACTKLSQIQVYDARVQKRPVINVQLGEEPFTVLAVQSENELIIGDRSGRVIKFDLRKKVVSGSLKGSAGAVKDIKIHQNKHVAVVGADRFLHVYNLNTCSEIHKLYLKSKLTSVLWINDLDSEPIKRQKIK